MAIIEFDNGQRVEFEGNPTPADVEEVAARLGIKPEQPAAAQAKQSIPSIVTSPIRGFVKEAIDLPRKVASLGTKVGQFAADKIVGPTGSSTAKDALQQSIERPEITKPKGIGEKIGAGIEQVAEVFAPVPTVGKARAVAEAASLIQKVGKAFKTAAIGALEQGGKAAVQTEGDTGQIATAAGTSLVVPLAGLTLKTPLTKIAERVYSSAAKFTESARKAAAAKGVDLVKTALENRVFLTQGGVERVAAKIDDMENMIGKAIDEADEVGTKISMKGLGSYIDEAKELFKYDFDVAAGQAAIKELDDIKRQFVKQYGRFVPIKEAQKIKVATGQRLSKYYGRLTDAGIEGRKAGTRYLKEEIANAAPVVGEINKRLSALYQLDKALDTSMGRVKKLNLLGLGPKILAASGQPEMVAAAGALQVVGSALNKSGIAIGANELAKLVERSGNTGKIPAVLLMRFLEDKLSGYQSEE